MFARWPLVLLLGCTASFIAIVGCGGGSSGGGEATPTPVATLSPSPLTTPSPTPTPTPSPTPQRQVAVSFGIDWPARSRTVTPPASARSFRLNLVGATGNSVLVSGDRREAPDAYTETYTSPATVPVGQRTVRVEFFADADANGAVVATGTAEVTIADDGSGIGTIALIGSIRSVEVPPRQSVGYAERKDLGFAARNDSGGLLAISPGSAFAAVVAGSDRLRMTQGIGMEGLRPGTAQVNVTVDGITSPTTSVDVTSTAQVSIAPPRVEVGAGKTTKFIGGIVGAPETELDWSAPNTGAVASDGTFTAPNTVGEYPVIVTSRWDSTKKAQATAVVVPSVSVVPASVTTTLRKTVPLLATVLGPSNANVRWSVTEPGGGTVNGNGVYTAPATPGVFHVVAESVADPRQKATVTVTVQSGNGNIHLR